MQDNITGKTILLICDFHYGCDQLMKSTLLELGAKEVVQKTLSLKGNLRRHITLANLINVLKNPMECSKKTRELVEDIDGYTFDTVLCVENNYFSKWFFDYLRKKNPNVSITMFLWDTVDKHHPRYNDFWPKFDKVFIFDRDEAKKYNFEYFPDFYIGEWEEPATYKYDIAFIGSMRRDITMNRASTLYEMQHFCKQNGLRPYFRLKYKDYEKKNVSLIKRIYRKVNDYKFWAIVRKYHPYGYIYNDNISLEEVNRIYNQSRALLDLGYPGRQGMTINCITALAKGKKLITTNKRIVEEPFYDPANVFVLDENNPQLDIEFFKTPTKPVNMEYLRIDNWLRHILNHQSINELK